MALTGQQHINIGNVNEQTGSDSLYDAFIKVENNFDNLFTNASPFKQFVSDSATSGIEVVADSDTGKVVIKHTGVANILPGTGIQATKKTNGDVELSVIGNQYGQLVAGVTSVGLSSSTLELSNDPVVTATGVIGVNLAKTDVVPGVYDRPKINVDEYGRVVSVEQSDAEGIVTSVGITGGTGISVAGSPITSNGIIRITNTGVTKIIAGSGIRIDSSGGTGNVTISATLPTTTQGTVKSVTVASTTLTIAEPTVTTTGTININLPTTHQYGGSVVAITPKANGSQSDATPITTGIVVIPANSSNNGAIKLPEATPGKIIRVLWPHTAPDALIGVRVYATGTATIDNSGIGGYYTVTKGKKVEFIAINANQWYTFVSA